MRNRDGALEAIPVARMTDAHLVRWVTHFRAKTEAAVRDQMGESAGGFDLPTIDLSLCRRFVTGPAIFAEAARRGLYDADTGALRAAPSRIVPGMPAAKRRPAGVSPAGLGLSGVVALDRVIPDSGGRPLIIRDETGP